MSDLFEVKKNPDLIDRSVIEDIKAEIEKQEKWLMNAGYNAYNVDIAFDAIKSAVAKSEE